jgi:hypothetical protein
MKFRLQLQGLEISSNGKARQADRQESSLGHGLVYWGSSEPLALHIGEAEVSEAHYLPRGETSRHLLFLWDGRRDAVLADPC